MNGWKGSPPREPKPTTHTQGEHTPERRAELGREALHWYLDGLGRHVPAKYLPAARQALADLSEELEIAASLARRAA